MIKRLGTYLILCFSIGIVLTNECIGSVSLYTGTQNAGRTDTIDVLLGLFSDFIKSNPQEAFNYALKAKLLSVQDNNEEKKAIASNYMGEAKIQSEEYYEAKNYLQVALEYYEKSDNISEIANIRYSLAVTSYYLGEYQNSLVNYQAALLLFEKLDKKQDVANTYQNLGLLHHDLDDINKAALYYNKALEINLEIANDTNIAGLYQNLGIVYYRNHEYDKATDYYKKSVNIFEHLKDTQGIATTYSNIGLIFLEKSEFENAFKYFDQSRKYFEGVNYKLGKMWAIYNMGLVRLSEKKYKEAGSYLNQSLEIARELDSPEGCMSCYKSLSDLYKDTKDYKAALDYFIDYSSVKDSTYSGELKSKIAQLETLYNFKIHEKQLTESRSELKRTKANNFTILVILLLMAGVALIAFIAYRQKRAAEVKLAAHKTNLENIIVEKTLELDNQITERKIVEESDKLKSAFLANMSHELRTPMNAIIAFTNFLKQPRLSAIKRDEYIEHISSASDSLLRLIDDIIDIAKLEANQLKISIGPTNISRILRELNKIFQEFKIKNNYSISLYLTTDKENDYIINTDSIRLKQILSNLLENAFKYTKAGEIEFGAMQVEEGIEFFVRDTGIGIPKSKQEKVFERFSQLENELDRKFGGTGLGLAISKNLVELMGGKIWIDSVPELGSTFYVIIPAVDIRKVPSANESSFILPSILKTRNYNWESKTILVAEDEELNYKVLDSCLSKTRAKVIRAIDGEKAVEICKNEKIDLVLMDIQMPIMDGYKATHEIKKMNNSMPVIAQTSFTMANERDKCIDAGCDDYITKPLDLDILLSMISKFIQE